MCNQLQQFYDKPFFIGNEQLEYSYNSNFHNAIHDNGKFMSTLLHLIFADKLSKYDCKGNWSTKDSNWVEMESDRNEQKQKVGKYFILYVTSRH